MKKSLIWLLVICCMLLSACSGGGRDVTEIPLSPTFMDGQNEWVFDVNYKNESKDTIYVVALELILRNQGDERSELYSGESLVAEGDASDAVLEPGESFSMYLTTKDMPVVEEYIFQLYLRDDSLRSFTKAFHYILQETDGRLESVNPTGGQAQQQPDQILASMGEIWLELVPENGTDWHFFNEFINDTGETLLFKEMEVVNMLNGTMQGSGIFTRQEIPQIPERVEPNETFLFDDWHGYVQDFNERYYILRFGTESGGNVEFAFRYILLGPDGSAPTPQQGQQSTEVPLSMGETRLELSPENGTDWHFYNALINDIGEPLIFKEVEIVDFLDGNMLDTFLLTLQDLPPIQERTEPDETFVFDDWHPYVQDFNERHYILRFETGSDGFIEFVFQYVLLGPDSSSTPPQSGGVVSPEEYDPSLTYATNGTDWQFPAEFVNDTGEVLTLQYLDVFDFIDGQQLRDFHNPAENLPASAVVQPGEMFSFMDMHPVVPDFNERTYVYVFRTASGQEVVKEFHFKLSMMEAPPQDFSGDNGHDIQHLRHDANFEVNVAPDVYWVPAVSLGQSAYTNADISNMLPLSPEEKRDGIHTLYEALQLFKIGNFTAADDNVRIRENGIDWEHHKPGYHAVRTNCGCCASDSNWLNYILQGDYEEVGFMATSQRDGSGHIFNYIKHEGWYYFIDLTHYRAADYFSAEESGNLNQYYATDFVLGNVHKAASPEAFSDYMQDTFNDPPGLCFLYTAPDCLAVDSLDQNGKVTICYGIPEGIDVSIVFDDPNDQMDSSFVDAPSSMPPWEELPHYPFG